MSQNKPQFQNPQPDSGNTPASQYFQQSFNTQIPAPTTSYNKLINFNTDIEGLFETVSVAPTAVPKSPYDQIKIYVNGATLRFYWYDNTAHVWHYVTATA